MSRNYIVVNNVNVPTWYANNTKLSAIYRNNVEIYRAQLNVMGNFSASDYYHPNGAYQRASKSGNTITFNVTQQIVKNIWTSSTINLNNYNTMKIAVNVTTSSNESGNNPNRKFYVMANASNTFNGDFSTRSDGLAGNPSSPGTSYYRILMTPQVDAISTGTRTITVDISNWKGNLKLGLGVLCGPANTVNMKVTAITLE